MAAFSLKMLISRDELPGDNPMFDEEDMELDQEFRSIFHENIIEAIEEVSGVKHGDDGFQIRGVDCSYSENKLECPVVLSSIKFRMTLKDTDSIPGRISYEMTPEAKKLHTFFKENIQRGVVEKVGRPVSVIFTRWGSGSLIVEGSVSLFHGEFTETQVKDVLEIVRAQGLKLCKIVIVEHLLPTQVDFSLLDFSIKLSPCSYDAGEKIQDDIPTIKELFLEKVVAALTVSRGECLFLLLLLYMVLFLCFFTIGHIRDTLKFCINYFEIGNIC